jgi:hypothetical protein
MTGAYGQCEARIGAGWGPAGLGHVRNDRVGIGGLALGIGPWWWGLGCLAVGCLALAFGCGGFALGIGLRGFSF